MKLIKIKTDHYVVVDDSEIKDGNWMIRDGEQPTLVTPNFWWDFGVPYKKITYSTQPMPHGVVREGQITGVTAISLQEVKELIGEVNVEKKAELYVWGGVYLTEQEKQQTEIAYMTGYNQALEDNKEKKYTEEDIKKIRQILVEGAITNMSCSSAVVELDKYIQSLQPKTEWEVEIIDGKLKLKDGNTSN